MKLSIKTNPNYDVIVDYSILGSFDSYLKSFNRKQLFIICFSSNLDKQSQKLKFTLKQKNYNVQSLEIRDGEKQKELDNVKYIIEELVDLGANRSTVLIALGGGSVGDVVGFVASIYMRGIKYINVPTTLLSMVDSSLGGKTAINYSGIKNIIGSFYQPSMVFIDPDMLLTLSDKDIRSGIGEIIKYGMIYKCSIIDKLTKNYNCIIQLKNKDLLLDIIFECCSIKKNYIESDERDIGIRNILNFGHTLGHLIESKYQSEDISHGEAIINGIRLSIELSYFKKLMSLEVYSKLMNICEILNIHYNYKLNEKDIDSIKYDKKQSSDRYRFILLKNIGEPIICDDISKDDILSVI